jgi:serine/threonine protein phosphatase PrpC
MPTASDHLMLAVFDGHGGAGASAWASTELIGLLENRKEWKEYVEKGKTDIELLSTAMKASFIDADAALRRFQMSGAPGADTSGCTAVVCMVTPTTIVCANAGDSRSVMASGGKTKEMSFDHKPYNNIERVRIEKAGGTVQFKRVDGDLAVSRAFGDFQYKTSPELPAEQQKVSPEPDIITHNRCDADEFLLLACDGLFDVMSNLEATAALRTILDEGESNMALVAEEMLDVALEKGSRDNISAVIVKFSGMKIAEMGGGVAARNAARKAVRDASEAADASK